MAGGADWGQWERVENDQDVRCFTNSPPRRGSINRKNRKHHFVSETYMKGFLNAEGRVWVYRLEAPEDPHSVSPSAVGYRNHYYSQTLPDGSRESHRFEDLWGVIEEVWEETRRAIEARRLSPAISMNVLGMATMMRVRVPAARDRSALLIAAALRARALADEKAGTLEPGLQQYAGRLETIPVGVNPDETLRAMGRDFRDFGDLGFRIGFEILHNTTTIPLVTSDNPVCIYDPRTPIEGRIPYPASDQIELIFPLDARTLLRGSTRLAPVNQIVRHRLLSDRREVRCYNETIAQFAYGFVIASDRSSDQTVARHADHVPTIAFDSQAAVDGFLPPWRSVLAVRPILSPFIDTPEKADRLQAELDAEGETGRA